MNDISVINKKNNKKKIKNISLNCSIIINKNIENRFKLRKHFSNQKMISRETKFSSKEYSSYIKDHSNKNINRNNSESVFELKKNIKKHIFDNNKKQNKKNTLKENQNFIGSYYSGNYILPLISVIK